MTYPKISDNSKVQAEYVRLRKKGQSHNLAEIFATETAPGLQTDTRFLHGKPDNGFYSRQLQSWVSSRADVKRICEEQGLNCEGGVTHRVSNDNPRPDEVPYRVADDLVESYVESVVAENPTALQDDPELPHKVRQQLEGDE